MYLNVYLFQNKSTGLGFLPKNDFQTGDLMEGRWGGGGGGGGWGC